MAKLYCVLYDLAKSDFKAANILAQNRLYAQAIYFYAQSFEKSIKSIIAFYEITYNKLNESDTAKILMAEGHKLRNLTEEILRIFVDKDKRLYVKRGGKEDDPFIQNAYKAINLKSQKYEEDYQVAFFDNNVRYHYEIYYKSLSRGQPLTLLDPRWGYLREQAESPKTMYMRYGMLARMLFSLLNKMDIAARYPIIEMNNMNIALLNRFENKRSCLSLEEMIGELIDLEPLVWNEIESLDET